MMPVLWCVCSLGRVSVMCWENTGWGTKHSTCWPVRVTTPWGWSSTTGRETPPTPITTSSRWAVRGSSTGDTQYLTHTSQRWFPAKCCRYLLWCWCSTQRHKDTFFVTLSDGGFFVRCPLLSPSGCICEATAARWAGRAAWPPTVPALAPATTTTTTVTTASAPWCSLEVTSAPHWNQF